MKKVDHLLHNDNTLAGYFRAAKRLTLLTEILKQQLPTLLKSHCQVANYQAGCLCIQTDNAAWATQLRYQLPDIQKKLQALSEFKDLKTIRYFVAPVIASTTPQKTSSFRISTEIAHMIDETAIPGKLGEALRKLARNAKDSSK